MLTIPNSVSSSPLASQPRAVVYQHVVEACWPHLGMLAWPAAFLVGAVAGHGGNDVLTSRCEIDAVLIGVIDDRTKRRIINFLSVDREGRPLSRPENLGVLTYHVKRGRHGGLVVSANLMALNELMGIGPEWQVEGNAPIPTFPPSGKGESREADQLEAVLDEMLPTAPSALSKGGDAPIPAFPLAGEGDNIEALLTEWEAYRSPATVREANGLRGLLAKFGEELVLRAMAESNFGDANSPVAYLRKVCAALAEVAEEDAPRPSTALRERGRRKGRKASTYHVASEEERVALQEQAEATRVAEEDAVLTSARTAKGKLEIETKILDYQQRTAPNEYVQAWNERKANDWQAVLDRAATLPPLPDSAYVEDVI